MPGYKPFTLYPLNSPDLARAHQLAGHNNAPRSSLSADLADDYIATEVADELARIGITVHIAYPRSAITPAALGHRDRHWTATTPTRTTSSTCSSTAAFPTLRRPRQVRQPWLRYSHGHRRDACGPARYTAYANLDAASCAPRRQSPRSPMSTNPSSPRITCASTANLLAPTFRSPDLATTCLR